MCVSVCTCTHIVEMSSSCRRVVLQGRGSCEVVARCDFLLPCNLIKTCMCACMPVYLMDVCVCVSVSAVCLCVCASVSDGCLCVCVRLCLIDVCVCVCVCV